MSARQNTKMAKVLTERMDAHHVSIHEIERAMPCSSQIFATSIPKYTSQEDLEASQIGSLCTPMATFEN